ncbi:leucine-rich_repeat domain-containing protein [Hexamita inflata]|uniref:Leucine-rich repeat domain-containing protein n=1 Tax=Hexamita inflata TaxID=28002 RepID=A0AA86PBR4_9EUKA|nr:leucine-rich repeat domain-containing protein [Hexamita inflata]
MKFKTLIVSRTQKNLEYLALNKNLLTDIYSLTYLVGLKNLYLSNNQILNISPLFTLSKLQTLELRNNCVVDIRTLQKLTHLDLSFNYILEFEAIQQHPCYTSYKLGNQQALDISLEQYNQKIAMSNDLNNIYYSQDLQNWYKCQNKSIKQAQAMFKSNICSTMKRASNNMLQFSLTIVNLFEQRSQNDQ